MAEKPLPLLGSMNAFNPNVDDWSAHVERLESFFAANDVKDECSGNCYWHKSLLFAAKHFRTSKNSFAPAKTVEKTYQQLVDAMKSYLDLKPIVIIEHF